METPYGWGTKVCSNSPDHMTKMAGLALCKNDFVICCQVSYSGPYVPLVSVC